MVSKTLREMKNDNTQLSNTPYTCKETDADSTCRILIKVISVVNDIRANVTYRSNQPKTYEGLTANTKSSYA